MLIDAIRMALAIVTFVAGMALALWMLDKGLGQK